jgi:hypothetical protein
MSFTKLILCLLILLSQSCSTTTYQQRLWDRLNTVPEETRADPDWSSFSPPYWKPQ